MIQLMDIDDDDGDHEGIEHEDIAETRSPMLQSRSSLFAIREEEEDGDEEAFEDEV